MKAYIASIVLGCGLLWCALPLAAAQQGNSRYDAPDVLETEELPLIPLLHKRWLTSEGAPANIYSIAQTPDGWLWLAGSSGLFRFDGVAFTRWRPPAGVKVSTNTHAIGTLPDGRLWVLPRMGGMYLIKGQEVRVYTREEGLPPHGLQKLAASPDGRLWLATGMGLYIFEHKRGRWRPADKEMDMSKAAHDVLVDQAGTVWVQTSQGNFAMRQGESRFTLVAPQLVPGALIAGPDGTVWAPDIGLRGVRRLTPGKSPRGLEELHGRLNVVDNMLVDSKGNFWSVREPGVVRIAVGGERVQAQGFSTRQGLSGNTTHAAFEDREGNVWVSSNGGLDQFRERRLREIPLTRYLAEARPLAVGPRGQLWIDYNYLDTARSAPRYFGPAVEVDTAMQQMHFDTGGTLWFSTFSRLWKLDGQRRVRVPLPPEVEQLVQQVIFAISRDAEGALWISLGPRGTWRLKDGAWVQHGGVEALKLYPATNLVLGPDGKLWLGSVNNSVAVLKDGKVTKVGPDQGLDIGTVLQIVPDAAGAWLAGDDGLARFDGKRAMRLQGEDGEQFAGTTGLLQAPDGSLWLNSGGGLVHIEPVEWKNALATPGYRVRFHRYDENDGLSGAPAPLLPMPSMVRTPDGQLLISTTGGVFHFDPARAVANRHVPPVHVTGISADMTTLAPGHRVTLPAAPANVRIDYTALSLSLPQRVRFRTMLEGVDIGWQDPGTRRSAFYTQLDPGEYIFRVKAANEDGVWNEEGAQLRLVVPPTMAQTLWFKAGCALAFLLFMYALHRLRLRMVLRRQSRLFDTRVAERERIARDLHDTLLQSVQGLIMHFRRIALKTPDDAPTRPLMQEALAMATEVLEEGRDRVGGLRTPAAQADLAALLDCHGQALAGQHPARFSLHEEGQARRLRAPVLDEVLAIGREAVRNAFLHAEAEHIDVTLRHGEREFEMVVTDDGVGIEPAMHAGRAGHWGICGMRERAAELGATFDLRSAPGEGSTWRLRLAARLAYADDGDTQAGPAATAERAGELQ